MAKRDRNKRAARKARQERRMQIEQAQLTQAGNKRANKKAEKARKVEQRQVQKASSQDAAKKQSENIKKTQAQRLSQKASKMGKKPKKTHKRRSILSRIGSYLSNVRQELKRVTWPTKKQLAALSVAVIIMLVIFGVAIWLIDTGAVEGLIQYSNLRS